MTSGRANTVFHLFLWHLSLLRRGRMPETLSLILSGERSSSHSKIFYFFFSGPVHLSNLQQTGSLQRERKRLQFTTPYSLTSEALQRASHCARLPQELLGLCHVSLHHQHLLAESSSLTPVLPTPSSTLRSRPTTQVRMFPHPGQVLTERRGRRGRLLRSPVKSQLGRRLTLSTQLRSLMT